MKFNTVALALLAVIGIHLFPSDCLAGNRGRFSGRVIAAATRLPLKGASLTLSSKLEPMVTGADGKFLYTGLKTGRYHLVISCQGYQTKFIDSIFITSPRTTSLDIVLEPVSPPAPTGAPDGSVALEPQELTSGSTEFRVSRNVDGSVNVSPDWEVNNNTLTSISGMGGSLQSTPFLNQNLSISTPGNQNLSGSFALEPGMDDHQGIQEGALLPADSNRFSTFSIDVDRASYSNVRRYLQSNALPPDDAVRVEEMINYFTYDYPQPSGDAPFSIVTDVGECPWNTARKLVRIGLQGASMDMSDLPPNNLVFLIDVSGSMDEPRKLPLLQQAFQMLVNKLRPQDRVAIVVYAGSAGLVLPSTPGSEKTKIVEAIERLKAGGSTAGAQGILLAYQIAKENFLEDGNNRVILATDGDFNVGVSSDQELVKLIEGKRDDGIFLTVIGVGTGNMKDGKMEQLADKGNGNYAYFDNVAEAGKVFISELGATLFTIAKDVKIQVEFNPEYVGSYRLIGYENRMLRREDFHDDKKDAGELGAGHSVTALYEIELANGAARPRENPDRPHLGYRSGGRPDIRHASLGGDTLMYVKLRYKRPDEDQSNLLIGPIVYRAGTGATASPDMKFVAAVTEFGMLLRNSAYKGTSSVEEIMRLAREGQGADVEGYRGDFIKLVDQYRRVSAGHP